MRRMLWVLLLVALAACRPAPASPPVATVALPDMLTPTAATPAAEPLAVFFTAEHPGHGLRGGLDATVAASIDAARLTVDAALYDLNLWSIRDALIRAHRRGVQVRVVAESDHLDEKAFAALRHAGIPIVGDGRKALMHDKFIVIDRYIVWTGSMNYTLNGVYRNDNNLVRLVSPRIAADYTAEFEEMFRDHRFGADSPANTPYPQVSLDGIPVEVYFAPEDHPLMHLLPIVRNARQSIAFMAFNLTDDDLARLLLTKQRQGVKVAGVCDAQQARTSRGNDCRYLFHNGVDVRLDGNPYAMHHKVFVVDGETVIFGSYNFTHSAETRNDENLLIVHDPLLAARFLQEFRRVYRQASEYNP